MKPLISVVIPTYNRAHLLRERALRSLVGQTEKNFEAIVIDDGSTDDTRRVLEPFVKRKEIRYFFKDNQGVSSARNAGVRKSRGKIIVFLDSDDELDPMYLTRARDVFNDENIEVFIPGFVLKDERGRTSYASPEKPLWMMGMGGGTAFRKSLFTKKGIWYDETLRNFEDSDFGFRAAQNSQIRFVDEPLYIYNFRSNVYRESEGNLSNHPAYLTRDFGIFKKKNLDLYKKCGQEALSYLYLWEGTVQASTNMKKARDSFFASFALYPNLRNFAYSVMSAPGSHLIYKFFHRLLIPLRRWYKVVKHSL